MLMMMMMMMMILRLWSVLFVKQEQELEQLRSQLDKCQFIVVG